MQKKLIMDKNELIKALDFINEEANVGAELVFHYKEDQESILLKVPTTIDNLNQKLAKVFCKSVKGTFLNKNDFELLNISKVREADFDTTYYYYDESYPDDLKMLFKKAEESYNYKKHNYKFIRGFVIKLSFGKSYITLYKVKNPLDFHVKPTTLTILMLENGFTSPANESLILSDKIDYLLIGNNLIVMNLDQLERKYKFDERIKLHSQNVISSLREKGEGIIEGFDILEQFLLENRGFAKKLNPIDFDGVLWKTEFKEIKKALQKHDKLNRHLKFNDDGNKFSIKSKIAAKLFFSLCNDLIMISILSGDVSTVSEKEAIE